MIAYLRVLDNPGDAVSMRRILNTPRRGIGDRAEACVSVYAENTGSSFADALQAAAEGKVPMLNSRSEKAIAAFVELLDDLRGHLDEDLGDLVEAVLERSGYRRELESSTDPQELARLDNLNELVSVAHEFSTDQALQTTEAAALAARAPASRTIVAVVAAAVLVTSLALLASVPSRARTASQARSTLAAHTVARTPRPTSGLVLLCARMCMLVLVVASALLAAARQAATTFQVVLQVLLARPSMVSLT